MAHRYTPEQAAFIIEHYKGRSNKELSEMINEQFDLNLSVTQVKTFKANRKLNSGLTGRFELGQVPVNKGTKGLYNVGGNRTSFKKGHKPKNYRPVGSERVNVDGYIEVKVADPNKWRLKHSVVWEEANGPIPKGHCVIFLDGNRINLSLDNLQLITRNQLARLNQNHLIFNDAELTKTGIIIADIRSKINDRKKKIKNN
jgi:hypothetical protein